MDTKAINLKDDKIDPRDTALVVAAEGLNMKLRSRAHLLAAIDALNLRKESVDARMPYVLALLSCGFSRARAASRLGLTANQVKTWRRANQDNGARYLEASSRGELMLEETMLLAAERDPEWAQAVLLGRKDEKDDIEEEKDEYDATDFLKMGKLERIEEDPLE